MLLLVFLFGSRLTSAADFDVCDIESTMVFEEWKEWTSALAKPYLSAAHNNQWVNIYIDNVARASALAIDKQYAECAKIVKLHFNSANGIEIRRLLLMVKMPLGFDPENGDWWYGLYDATIGTSVIEEGIIVNCISCHKQASSSDYIFSKEMIENSVE